MAALPPLARCLLAGKALLGGALLARPVPIARRVAGEQRACPPAWVIRLLGARLLVQGGIESAVATPRTLLVGSAIDATHAMSMIPLALTGRYRRVAAASAGVAALSAAFPAAFAARPAGRGRR